ncbi:hypothetical protein LJC57_00945 [Parabacteroides sp. OttesenSCG-928-G07]|nr:hypothetical protein [Parabacteroides sp. OttesenSCG-928-G07]
MAFLLAGLNDKITTYSDKDFGFKSYYLGDLCATTDEQVFITIDYSLSSMMHNDGPHLFSFDGKKSQTIETPSDGIHVMTTDSKGNIWCSTWRSGDILKYNNGRWSILNAFPAEEDNGIFCIKEAPDGKLWIGTGQGIYIVEV